MAEAVFFLKLFAIAITPAAILAVIVALVYRWTYLHYEQISNVVRGIFRIICWVIIYFVDGKAKADCLKIHKQKKA